MTARQWSKAGEVSRSANRPLATGKAWLATTAAIGAVCALITPANALPYLFRDSGPIAAPPGYIARPPGNLQRLPRAQTPASRPNGRQAGTKADPRAHELAARAKGPLHIIVSLDRQQLTLYAGGQAVARSRVSTGTRRYPTPTGIFSVIQKNRWHRSNLYDDAPMFYMQRITWSGIALHQGVVPNHPASHGCIRLPEAFARQLWATTRLGARVIVARDDVAPVAFSHPRLFAPKRGSDVTNMSSTELQNAADRVLKMAQAANLPGADSKTTSDASKADEAAPATDAPKAETPGAALPPLKPGPISVFVSRKEGKLFVRKGFEPVLDVPVAIDRPQEPLGTHVFTAMGIDETNAVRWTVVTMPSAKTTTPSPAAALDRITIPQDALDLISSQMSAGASLIISDQGLGPETGRGTDFVVLTR